MRDEKPLVSKPILLACTVHAGVGSAIRAALGADRGWSGVAYHFRNLMVEGGEQKKAALIEFGRKGCLRYFQWYDDPTSAPVNR